MATDCRAWLDFFDFMQGPTWDFGWEPVRSDPCGIDVNPNQRVRCSADGTRITSIRFIQFAWFELPPAADGGHLVETLPNGTIPASIGNLDALQELVLGGGCTVGPLPDALGQLPSLEVLALIGVNAPGTIPTSIGQLTQLRQLSLFNNAFEGTIPASFARLTGLEVFQLPAMENLTGAVPAMSFDRMADWGCSLEQCNFTCPLPPGAEARCGARCGQSEHERALERAAMANRWAVAPAATLALP